MSITADLLMRGPKVNYQYLDATSTWDSDTNHKAICPAGKRWFVLNGVVIRDVSSTATITVIDASDVILCYIQSVSAGTGDIGFMGNLDEHKSPGTTPLLRIDEGEKIEFDFGTAQTGAASLNFTVIEVDA